MAEKPRKSGKQGSADRRRGAADAGHAAPSVEGGGPHKSATRARTGKAGSPEPDGRSRPPRGATQAARRAAILAAGLHVFAEHGFEAARLDDVAVRAGVAKGTLYLYFKDKLALFEEIVRSAASPVIATLEMMAQVPDVPTRLLLERLMATFVQQVLQTERKLVLRLVISEGPRFPEIARFYYDEVVSRGLVMVGRVLERGVAKGEIAPAAVAQFPQLVIAPLLMALIWDGLFQRFAPLDVPTLLATYLDLLAAPAPGSTPS